MAKHNIKMRNKQLNDTKNGLAFDNYAYESHKDLKLKCLNKNNSKKIEALSSEFLNSNWSENQVNEFSNQIYDCVDGLYIDIDEIESNIFQINTNDLMYENFSNDSDKETNPDIKTKVIYFDRD